MKFKNIAFAAILAAGLVFIGIIVADRASGIKPVELPAAETAAPTAEIDIVPEQTVAPFNDTGAIRISEFMPKNKSFLMSEDGGFYDWIELENVSDRVVSLEGWGISDKVSSAWTLPQRKLEPGEFLVIYASGREYTGNELHADFSLSENETIYLTDPLGEVEDEALCEEADADESYVVSDRGEFISCLYPTPGKENSVEAYELLQSERIAKGPIIINEAASKNYAFYFNTRTALPDWVEIKNISSSSVSLSDYYLSDTFDNLKLWKMPDISLAPGEITLILCTEDKDEIDALTGQTVAPLSLDSDRESLFISSSSEIVDYLSLRDIPYGGSIGRMSGENGAFLFDEPTPNEENSGAKRYYCECPTSSEAGGVYEGIDSLTVSLSGTGTVYYTLDGSVPTRESAVYSSPITLTETTVLRAISSDGVGLDSRAATFSYIINEGHTLPVLSVVGDDPEELEKMYSKGIKGPELSGAIQFFDNGDGFSIDCGIKMAGRASLERPKKNLTFKFRGSYGEGSLDYDLFNGGITSFTSLTLRAGQDNELAVIRNELSEELCLQFTDKALTQRSRFCVMYMNGEYYGLFALKEKINEAFCADYEGCSKESIQIYNSPFVAGEEFYNTVYQPCSNRKVADDAEYQAICDIFDVDSFIDWCIIQGYTGNFDILYGNVSFYRSSETDNKWTAIVYDLDAAFRCDFYNFRNLYNIDYNLCQAAQILMGLLENPTFREKYLTRTGQALSSTLTNESVVNTIEGMYALIDEEMKRDCIRWNLSYDNYYKCRNDLIDMITASDYKAHSIETIANMTKLNDEERVLYFGQ